MSILDLPCELYLLIADHLTSPRDIHHLLLTHRGLANFMAPVLARYAEQPANSIAALFCFAANRNSERIKSHLTALHKRDPQITTDVDSILSQGPNLIWKSPCEWYEDWDITLGKSEFQPRSAVQRALHWAVINNKISMIQFLLSQGAEIDYRDPKTGGKAIDHAIRQGSVEIVKLLIHNGADVSVWEKKCGSLLHCTIGCIRRGLATLSEERELAFKQIMVLLLEGGADISVRDTYKHTALHIATLCWHGVIPLLLEWGADINAPDDRGNTPLHLAVLTPPSNTIVDMLLKRGADPTIRNAHGHMPSCLMGPFTAPNAVSALTNALEHRPGKCCKTVSSQITAYDMRLIPFRNIYPNGGFISWTLRCGGALPCRFEV